MDPIPDRTVLHVRLRIYVQGTGRSLVACGGGPRATPQHIYLEMLSLLFHGTDS